MQLAYPWIKSPGTTFNLSRTLKKIQDFLLCLFDLRVRVADFRTCSDFQWEDGRKRRGIPHKTHTPVSTNSVLISHLCMCPVCDARISSYIKWPFLGFIHDTWLPVWVTALVTRQWLACLFLGKWWLGGLDRGWCWQPFSLTADCQHSWPEHSKSLGKHFDFHVAFKKQYPVGPSDYIK